MKRKTILIIGKLPPPFMGPAVAFQILTGSKLKDYYDLKYLDIKVNTDLKKIGSWSPGKIIKNIAIYRKFRRLVKESRPELVLIPVSQSTSGFFRDAVFILIAAMFKCKILTQLRGGNFKNWYNNSGESIQKFVRYVFSKCVGVIVLGEKLKYIFDDFFQDENIYVIPNGGDYDIPEKTIKQNEIISLVYTGNLQSGKGIEDVIESIKIVTQRNLPVILDVIGSWRNNSTKQYCIDEVNTHKLPVTFHTELSGDDKMKIMAAGDIFIFPPRDQEGHPWVIIEAMACGLPVITTDKGAITESVINGENGFVVPEKSPGSLAEKISELAYDPAERKRMSDNSRKFYEEKFTLDKMVENYIRVFDHVIDPQAENKFIHSHTVTT